MFGRRAQRQLAQRGQRAASEELCQRLACLVGHVNLAFLQPPDQIFRRQINQLDLVGLVEHLVRNRLAHRNPGDARNDIVQAFQMLHVERRPDVEAGFQQVRHILVALGMARTLDIRVRQFVPPKSDLAAA